MQKSVRIALLLAVSVFIASAAYSQQPTASLTGVVTDPNGAVIAGSNVTATNKETSFSRTATTNSEGIYTISNLPVGQYEIKFAAQNFSSFTRLISSNVGQTLSIDATLYPAGIIVDYEVMAQALVDTQASKVDAVVDDKTIDNLPLNGRNFLELALLTPGNAPAPNFDPTKTNTVVISSAGQVGRGGNVMVDGTDNNDDVVGGALINISQDAVQEFQVATNRFSAEYGRTGSAVINVVTKSGTNMLHGSASFFERDRRLQALPATFDRSLPTPPFDRQQYSFTLGGPFIKDKLFGFGAVEYRRSERRSPRRYTRCAEPANNERICGGTAPGPVAQFALGLRRVSNELAQFSIFI